MKTPWWFLHRTPISFILWPVSMIYYGASRMVYAIRKIKLYKSRRPIICVGNILAGGVGKTPIVRAIANYFSAPVVMRGYKQDIKHGRVADEACMLLSDGLQVHTGNRKSNFILLNKQTNETGPIIMDDGFQNSSIYKDISIIVFDESIGLGSGFLLPAGPLREPRSSLQRADAFIVIKSGNNKSKLELPVNKPIFFAENKTIVPFENNEKLVAFAGIGYPKKFFKSLKNVVATRAFADHYQYTDDDIDKLLKLAEKNNAKLITTEKDWVRLSPEKREKIQFAKLETTIEDKFFDWIKERLK